MKITSLILILLFIGCNSWAVLPSPPVVKDIGVQQYFQSLYDNHNNIPILTATPNSVRTGATGDIVILNNGGTFQFWVNRGGKIWTRI